MQDYGQQRFPNILVIYYNVFFLNYDSIRTSLICVLKQKIFCVHILKLL